jgi:1-deoxy-D-xylulose-5-phosphate synthase
VAVRYPRGTGAGIAAGTDLSTLPFGKAEIRREGQGLCILAFGTLLYPAMQVAEKLNATVVNMRWAKPLDVEMVLAMAERHAHLVTLEDACVMGGAGSAVCEALQTGNVLKSVLNLGLPDEFVEHGDPAKLMALLGLDAQGIETSIRRKWPALGT